MYVINHGLHGQHVKLLTVVKDFPVKRDALINNDNENKVHLIEIKEDEQTTSKPAELNDR